MEGCENMKRVFLIVLDSFGVGEMPDAADFGDKGSNTLAAVSRGLIICPTTTQRIFSSTQQRPIYHRSLQALPAQACWLLRFLPLTRIC